MSSWDPVGHFIVCLPKDDSNASGSNHNCPLIEDVVPLFMQEILFHYSLT